MAGTLGREVISTRQRKIAELAQREPKLTLTTLAHHIDAVWMREAWRRTRKDAAAGVDGVTAAQYEAELEANLSGLLERFKSGRYRAPGGAPGAPGEAGHEQDAPDWHSDTGGQDCPTRGADGAGAGIRAGLSRLLVWIPAGAWRSSGAGSAVARADGVWWRMGHRPGHRGLLRVGGLGSPEELSGPTGARRSDTTSDREVAERRSDGGGRVELSAAGHAARRGDFPGLSSIYLHEVLDEWFEHEVKPRLRGRAFEIRYADDAVLVFEHEDDARRVLGVLAKRLEKYGLRLHPDKTRMVEFCRPSKSQRGGSQAERSFAMLGFTHYWGRSQEGAMGGQAKTAKDRLSRALWEIGHWCRTHRHWKLRDQQAALSRSCGAIAPTTESPATRRR